MNKTQILKGYLVHFIYMPIAVINSLVVGEDVNTMGLIIFITLIIGAFAFGINYSITHLGLTIFKSKVIWAFLLPTLVQLVLYVPINSLLQNLDFGGNYIYITFVGISSIINVGVFIVLNLKY